MSTESFKPLRVGILGAASIARKNVRAIQQHDVTKCKVVAIASRSAEKANTLKTNHIDTSGQSDIEIFAGSDAYERLIKSNLVDAVYIPLPTCLKKEWVLAALGNKKHVLVEKPVAASAGHYETMIAAAKLNKRYLMDGTMFVHNSRTKHMLEHIAQIERFGRVTRINSEFTFRGDEDFLSKNIRTQKGGDPYGCVGDLGWYCVRLAQLVSKTVGANAIKSVRVSDWKLNAEGVPIDASCLVTFHYDTIQERDNDFVLSFHCSFNHPLRQRCEIAGTRESLEMSDFVIPMEGPSLFRLHSEELTVNDTFSVQSSEVVDMPSGPAQEVLMWMNFHTMCKSVEDNGWAKDQEPDIMSRISCETQVIIDALMESIEKGGDDVKLDQ